MQLFFLYKLISYACNKFVCVPFSSRDAAFDKVRQHKDELVVSEEWNEMVKSYPMLVSELLIKLL